MKKTANSVNTEYNTELWLCGCVALPRSPPCQVVSITMVPMFVCVALSVPYPRETTLRVRLRVCAVLVIVPCEDIQLYPASAAVGLPMLHQRKWQWVYHGCCHGLLRETQRVHLA